MFLKGESMKRFIFLFCIFFGSVFGVSPQEFSQMFSSRGGAKVRITFDNILVFIFLVIVTFIIIKLLYVLKNYRIYKRDREKFLQMAEERNMTYHQIKIMETLAKKNNVFLTQLLTNKKLFNELVVKEKKYLRSKFSEKSKIFLDFYSNIEYINSVFYKKKPAPGEIIHSSRDIHIGTRMIIYKKSKEPYPVKGIIVYMDNNMFILQVERKKSELSPLMNEKVYIFFTHENDASYEFEANILDFKEVQSKEKTKTNIYISHSDNLIRRQRRKFIRVRTNIAGVITEEIFDDTKVPTSIKVTLIDISEGGACIKTDVPIKVNALVILSFYLENMLSITAKILHIKPSENNYIMHLEFVNMDESAKYIVRKFVNEHSQRRV